MYRRHKWKVLEVLRLFLSRSLHESQTLRGRSVYLIIFLQAASCRWRRQPTLDLVSPFRKVYIVRCSIYFLFFFHRLFLDRVEETENSTL